MAIRKGYYKCNVQFTFDIARPVYLRRLYIYIFFDIERFANRTRNSRVNTRGVDVTRGRPTIGGHLNRDLMLTAKRWLLSSGDSIWQPPDCPLNVSLHHLSRLDDGRASRHLEDQETKRIENWTTEGRGGGGARENRRRPTRAGSNGREGKGRETLSALQRVGTQVLSSCSIFN